MYTETKINAYFIPKCMLKRVGAAATTVACARGTAKDVAWANDTAAHTAIMLMERYPGLTFPSTFAR